MTLLRAVRALFVDSASLYWMLLKIVLPVMVATRIAVELGLIDLLAPAFAPVMTLLGLPPELGFALVTAMLVGVWGGAAAVFALVPPDAMTAAQVTVFSALIMFAHALPIEQRIVQKAGPGLVAMTALRLVAAFVYGYLLHRICRATGWLDEPVSALWVPASPDPGWIAFAWTTAESLLWMFAVLLAIVAVMKLLEAAGLMPRLTALLSPVLRIAGVSRAATPLTIVGLTLGLAYGGGLIIREARSGRLDARDVFLASCFMALAHGLIEDTLVVLALGADVTGVLVGRIVFSLAVVAAIARLVPPVPGPTFFRLLYNGAARQ